MQNNELEMSHSAVSAQSWAKKYLQQLSQQDALLDLPAHGSTEQVAYRLKQELRSASLTAWRETEALLAQEAIRHQIDPSLIDPWQISKDAHTFFDQALTAYGDQTSQARLAVQISDEIGTVRQRYAEADPRVIGFVSMQFFYTGRSLLKSVRQEEQDGVIAYFNVISDQLYMPLKRAFNAAGKHRTTSPRLQVVRKIMPLSTEIAHRTITKVLKSYPTYRCHHGLLSDPNLKNSGIRDVEMFQTYLWVCILENRIDSIQEELFPLCVMLYPKLKVSWELVRQMVHLLGNELKPVLTDEQWSYFQPFYDELWQMFSPQVFPDINWA